MASYFNKVDRFVARTRVPLAFLQCDLDKHVALSTLEGQILALVILFQRPMTAQL